MVLESTSKVNGVVVGMVRSPFEVTREEEVESGAVGEAERRCRWAG